MSILKSSGDIEFDQSAIRATRVASPFSELKEMSIDSSNAEFRNFVILFDPAPEPLRAQSLLDRYFSLVFFPAPQYPRRAQTRGIPGYCIVEVTIKKTGHVKDVEVVEENPEGWGFCAAALRAAKEMFFEVKVMEVVWPY